MSSHWREYYLYAYMPWLWIYERRSMYSMKGGKFIEGLSVPGHASVVEEELLISVVVVRPLASLSILEKG